MATILYANNAAGTLAAGITNVSTSLTLNPGQAALFPAPVPPQVFYVTLTDAATQTLIEIVQVTAVSGNVFSIVRAQDGTSALSWNAGDIVSQRTIRLELQGFENAAEGLFGSTGQNVAITPSTTLGIKGTTAGDNANAGSVGEYLSVSGGPFPIGSATVFNGALVSLTAGDWDVSGTVAFIPAAGTTSQGYLVGISLTTGAISDFNGVSSLTITQPPSVTWRASPPVYRVNVSVTTSVYLVGSVTFSGGTMQAQSLIRARRVR